MGHWVNVEPAIAVEPESQPLDPAVLLTRIWREQSPEARHKAEMRDMATSFFGDMLSRHPSAELRPDDDDDDGEGVFAMAQGLHHRAGGARHGRSSALLRHLQGRYSTPRSSADPNATDLVVALREDQTVTTFPAPATAAVGPVGASDDPRAVWPRVRSWLWSRISPRGHVTAGQDQEREEAAAGVEFSVRSEVVFLAGQGQPERRDTAQTAKKGTVEPWIQRETEEERRAAAAARRRVEETSRMKATLQESVARIRGMVLEAQETLHEQETHWQAVEESGRDPLQPVTQQQETTRQRRPRVVL